ncbi:putative ABC-type transport system, permease component [Desulfosporosinus orientis DSM 765]|uniref:Putative ABC-type transport system, permease component n=1 Tax=Desulfosporosinus orientis (strain ATCC 19365 / DSM 765 / NCIMB 8382 / VKM B-1628 / Singapore I) TaxID=768706 RepID=G7WH86_DESOD|nr:ABC transporter permease [Desulfosporosinus orientis]AET69594.1 putative ABC-type transport system, permease component [Desulfosporosinus orientis DSM 765]
MDSGFVALVTMYLVASVRMATPLILAGLGEAVSEKAGILNIGVEAIMLSGAFFSFIVAFFSGNLFLGLLTGIAGGILVSMIHGLLSIHCKANQTIAGLALNFMVMGLTSFLFLIVFGQTTTIPSCAMFNEVRIPLLSDIPIVGPALFNQNIFVYIALAGIVLTAVFFYKTEWGINLHAVGEHPQAANSAGLNVFAIRYFACLVNGILGGLGGASITLGQLGFFMENVTSGRGYIALVVVILGRRNPVGILAAAMVIGFSQALQYNLQTLGFPIPTQVFSMFPYAVAVIVLFLSIGKSIDPAALGIPFERNKR